MAGEFPKSEQGYFHLTPTGWVRQDQVPFPQDRCETWLYEMEWPQEDAKERVTLTRIWRSPSSDTATNDGLRALFGDPVAPTQSRNVTLECRA
jgi:hypothetical protein